MRMAVVGGMLVVEDGVHAGDEVPDFVAHGPVRVCGVPDWEERDEVGFFISAPREVVALHTPGRRGSKNLLGRGVRTRPPYGLHGSCLRSIGDNSIGIVDKSGVISAVERRNVDPRIALPEILPWLLFREVLDLRQEVVRIANVPDVYFPVPDIIKLGMRFAEPLHRHELVPVNLPIGDEGVHPFAHVFVPEDSDGAKLFWDVRLEHLFVGGFGGVDGLGAVFDVDEEEDLIFAAGAERKFSDHGAYGNNVVFGVVVAFPCAD